MQYITMLGCSPAVDEQHPDLSLRLRIDASLLVNRVPRIVTDHRETGYT
jgi:hypothetical protein